MLRSLGLFLILVSVCAGAAMAQTREERVRGDRDKVEGDGYWIYNDLAQGVADARSTGKPLLIVLRCVPCEACAQLDSDVVERSPLVRPLLDQFVCVRIIRANGLDLNRFQFDYDQSWAAFFMNAEGTIYGRYGTRSHQTESDDDVSLEGFAKALEAALDMHQQKDELKAALRAKQGQPVAYRTPEQLPTLRGEYGSKLNWKDNVVKSCIHCHQVGEALRDAHRQAGKPIPQKLLYPYPHPKALGLIMDPHEKATVKRVEPGTPAADAGFRAGDHLQTLAGQPLLSIADIQWVLHNTGDEADLSAEVNRDGQVIKLTLQLQKGWRQRDTISWRASSWSLRRMVTGGLLLEEIDSQQRRQAGLEDDALALRVRHVGQYGPHAAAKRAGFQKGDLLISIDGRAEAMRESDMMTWLVNAKRPGQRAAVVVLRDGKRVSLQLPIQE